MNKSELKKHLKELGIKVEGNYVRASELDKVATEYYEQMLDSYLETMLWSSTDGDHPLDDNYGADDVAKEVIEKSKKEIQDFCKKADSAGVDLTKYPTEEIGHDFWLTRNGHGAGFWDGDYDDNDGKILTEISKSFGSLDPYVGDDNKIYVA